MQWRAKVFSVRTQAHVLERIRGTSVKPVHSLQRFPTTLSSWADSPVCSKKSSVILTILSLAFHYSPPTRVGAYVWKLAVSVSARQVRDEGAQEEEKTGLDL